jgi:uncharacterized delta-60 repeat protein
MSLRRRPIPPALLAAAALAVAAAPLAAQIGELDPAFSGDGRETYAPAGDFADARAARADASAGVIVVGDSREGIGNDVNTDFLVVRFDATGARDLGFGIAGRRRVGFDLEGDGHDYADAVWIRPDGRILVHGLAQNDPFDSLRRTPALLQLTADGDPDPSFSGDGKQVLLFPDNGFTYGSSTQAIQPAAGGAVWVTGWCVECTPDGRLRLALARVLADGTHDTGFGVDGWLLLEPPAPIPTAPWGNADWQRTADGKLWAAVGNTTGTAGVLRLTAQGVPDTTWGPGGWVVTSIGDQGPGDLDFPAAFVVDGRGRPLVSWRVYVADDDEDVRIFRWTRTGELDATFGGGAVTLDLGGQASASGLVAQGRSLLVVGSAVTDFQNGAYDFLIARYRENGQLDPEFGGNGLTYVAFDVPGEPTHDFATDLALVAGRPVIVGTAWERTLDGPESGETDGTRWALARLQESWIFSDGFDQGGTGLWSSVTP